MLTIVSAASTPAPTAAVIAAASRAYTHSAGWQKRAQMID
jgi:hypothetical protein